MSANEDEFPDVGQNFRNPDDSDPDRSPADRERSSAAPVGGSDDDDDSDDDPPGGFGDGAATGGGTGGGRDRDRSSSTPSTPADREDATANPGGSAGTEPADTAPSQDTPNQGAPDSVPGGSDTLERNPNPGQNAPTPDDAVLSTVPQEEDLARQFANQYDAVSMEDVDITRTAIGGELIARVDPTEVPPEVFAAVDSRRVSNAEVTTDSAASRERRSAAPVGGAADPEVVLTGADAGTISGAAGANIGESRRGSDVLLTGEQVAQVSGAAGLNRGESRRAIARDQVRTALEEQGYDPENFVIDTTGENVEVRPQPAPGDGRLGGAEQFAESFDRNVDSFFAGVENAVESGVGPFGGVGNIPRIIPPDSAYEPTRGVVSERFEDRYGPQGGGAELLQDLGLVAADAVQGVSSAPETAVNVGEGGLYLLEGTAVGGGVEGASSLSDVAENARDFGSRGDEFDQRVARTERSLEPIATTAANNPQRTAAAVLLGTAAETALLRGAGRVSTPDIDVSGRAATAGDRVSEVRTRAPNVEVSRADNFGLEIDPFLRQQIRERTRSFVPDAPTAPDVGDLVEGGAATVAFQADRAVSAGRRAFNDAETSVRRVRRGAGDLPADLGLTAARARGRAQALREQGGSLLEGAATRPDLSELPAFPDAPDLQAIAGSADVNARLAADRLLFRSRELSGEATQQLARARRRVGDLPADVGLAVARARGRAQAVRDRDGFEFSGFSTPEFEEFGVSGTLTNIGQSALFEADRALYRGRSAAESFLDDTGSATVPVIPGIGDGGIPRLQIRLGPLRPPRATVPDEADGGDANLGPFADANLGDLGRLGDDASGTADTSDARNVDGGEGQSTVLDTEQADPQTRSVDAGPRARGVGVGALPAVPGVGRRARDPLVGALNRRAEAASPSVGVGGVESPAVGPGIRADTGIDASTGTELTPGVGNVLEFGVDGLDGDSFIQSLGERVDVDEDTTPDIRIDVGQTTGARPRGNFPSPGGANYRPRLSAADAGDNRRRADSTAGGGQGLFADPLSANWLSETVAAFAGVGVEARGAPSEEVFNQLSDTTVASGSVPVAAFFSEDEETRERAEAAFEFFSFGGRS